MKAVYKFPERLKELMLDNNLTQNKLSKETGISQSEIARWLSGARRPNVDFIVTLALFFNCSADYLIGLED